MRLVKSVGVVLSLAASGSVALVLSAGAYADSGTGTIAQSPPVSNSAQVVKSTVVIGGSGTNSSVDGNQPKDGLVSPGASGGSDSGPTVTNSQSQIKSDGSAKPAVTGGTTGGPGVNQAKTDPVVPTAAPADDQKPAQRDEQAAGAALLAEAAAPAGAKDTMVVNSEVLRVQPRITMARTVRSEDLAAMVPTAMPADQTPAKAPQPPASSGLIIQLTSVLAASVVPLNFSWQYIPHVLVPGGFTATLVALALLLLASSLALRRVALSFGAYLRRGGYANAARSDVVVNFFNLLFATPSRLGYVTATVPIRSPFLMVSDSKSYVYAPNAFRKEEMR